MLITINVMIFIFVYLVGTKKVKDEASIETATSAEECLQVLVKENIFTHNDVIFMQFLCRETECTELDSKCQDYAKAHKALCFFEKPKGNFFYSPLMFAF